MMSWKNIQQQTNREKKSGWLILLIAALSGPIAAVFPEALVIAPALWAFAGARTKPYWIALPAAGFIAAAFYSYAPVPAAGLSGAAVLSSILVFALLTRRVSKHLYRADACRRIFSRAIRFGLPAGDSGRQRRVCGRTGGNGIPL